MLNENVQIYIRVFILSVKVGFDLPKILGGAVLVCEHICKQSVFIGIYFLPLAEKLLLTCKRFL